MRYSLLITSLLLLPSMAVAYDDNCGTKFVEPTWFCGKECSAKKFYKRRAKNCAEMYAWQEEEGLRYKIAWSKSKRTGQKQPMCLSKDWTVKQPMSECSQIELVDAN